jgi:hypothetical protein
MEYTLRFTCEDYDTLLIPLKLKYHEGEALVDVGVYGMRRIPLSEKQHLLDDVVVTATKVKFLFRNDTLVYNADAFRLSNGSMLDELIRQLPGAKLNEDGSIYINGRHVDNLLLNGRDFFKGKNKVMLDNLPAYKVNHVDVYEEETELNKVLKTNVQEGRYVMNVSLKRQYQIGWDGNAEVSAGTEDRYIARLFLMRSTPQSRISVYGNMNNINDSRKPGNSGDWSASDLGGGLTMTRTAGIDYGVYDKKTRFTVEGNAQVLYTDNDYTSRTSVQDFLSGGDMYERSWSEAQKKNFTISTSHKFFFKWGTNQQNNISIEPQFNYNKYNRSSDYLYGAFHENIRSNYALQDSLRRISASPQLLRILLNKQDYRKYEDGHSYNSGVDINSTLRLSQNSDDVLGWNLYTSYNNVLNASYDHTSLFYPSTPLDFRNRFLDTPNKSFSMGGDINYYRKVGTHRYLTVRPQYAIKHTYYNTTHALYRLEQLNDMSSEETELGLLPSSAEELLSALDVPNSYTATEYTTHHTGSVQFFFNRSIEKGNISLNLIGNANYLDKKMYYHGSTHTQKEYHSWFWTPFFEFKFESKNWKHIVKAKYYLEVSTPSLLDMMDVTYDSDPLNIRKGNPGLGNTSTHSIMLEYHERNWLDGTGEMLITWIGHKTIFNAISQGYVYNKETGVRTITPQNVDGNHITSIGAFLSTPLGKPKKLTIYDNICVNLTENTDLVGIDGASEPSKNSVYMYNLSNLMKLYYKLGKHQIGFTNTFSLSHYTGSRSDFNSFNANEFQYGLTAIVKLPFNMELSTDITEYVQRGYNDASMNTQELVWNARLSKSLLKESLILSLDGFDILGNLSNISFSVNGQGRTETWINSIPRYAMFHVVYRFHKQPKKRA